MGSARAATYVALSTAIGCWLGSCFVRTICRMSGHRYCSVKDCILTVHDNKLHISNLFELSKIDLMILKLLPEHSPS